MILLLFIALASVNFGSGKKPNVLLIVIDDLKPVLGAYGDTKAKTPNIDKLANESFVFTNAFAQQALCAPSRNSFLTSRRPDTLHLYNFYRYWRHNAGNFTTLPQHFKDNGYFTHSIGKVFHPGVSSNFTDDYPYSWSKIPYHPSTADYKNSKVCLDPDGVKRQNLVCPVRVEDQPEETLPDLQSTNAAIEFLQKKDSITDGKPYFLAVGFHKPHIPYRFPRKYLNCHPLNKITLPLNRNRPSAMPTVAWNPWIDFRLREDIAALNISFPFGKMPDKVHKKIIQAYYASVTYIDDLIGDVLKAVHDDDTIIALVGDHGVSLGEHGEFSKFSNFDEATRVPFMIKVPKFSTEQIVCPKMIELLDLFPTLVDLTCVSPPIKRCNRKTIWDEDLCTEGRSLVPHMARELKKTDGENTACGGYAYSQYPRPSLYPTIFPNSDKPKLEQIKIMGYSVRSEQFRYTEWVEFNNTKLRPNFEKSYAQELYDHFIDPGENMNIADRKEMSGVICKLRKKLQKLTQQ